MSRKQQLRRVRLDRRGGLGDVAGFGDDLHPGKLGQQPAQLAPGQGLVVDDHCFHGAIVFMWLVECEYARAPDRDATDRDRAARSGAEQQSQPLCRIAQADAVRGRLAGRRGTRVLDFDDQRAVAHFGADPQHATLLQLGDPVLDRILDDGLQQHHWNVRDASFQGDRALDAQTLAEPQRFELEIVGDDLQLAFQRDDFLLARGERVAQCPRQLRHRVLRARSDRPRSARARCSDELNRKCGLSCDLSSRSSATFSACASSDWRSSAR